MILQSCKKSETPIPDITISAPSSGLHYSYGDTILLQFTASPASSVSYAIMQDERIVSVNHDRVFFEGNTYAVEFYLTDKYLPAGKYTIRVQANNNGSVSSAFVHFFYAELPLQVLGFGSLSSTELGRLDSSGAFGSISTNEAFDFLELNSPGSYLALAAKDGPLKAYDFNSLTPDFSMPLPQASGFSQYSQILSHESEVIALQADGRIVKLDEDGTISRSATVVGNEIPLQGAMVEDKLAVVTQELGNPQKHLRIYNSNLVEEKNAILAAGYYKLCAYANGELGLFKFVSGNTEFLLYRSASNLVSSVFTLNAQEVLDCEKVGNGRIIFTTNSATYTYQKNVQQSPKEVLNFALTDLEVSKVNQEILVLHQGSIKSLSATGSLVYRAPAVQNAIDFEIFYNK